MVERWSVSRSVGVNGDLLRSIDNEPGARPQRLRLHQRLVQLHHPSILRVVGGTTMDGCEGVKGPSGPLRVFADALDVDDRLEPPPIADHRPAPRSSRTPVDPVYVRLWLICVAEGQGRCVFEDETHSGVPPMGAEATRARSLTPSFPSLAQDERRRSLTVGVLAACCVMVGVWDRRGAHGVV